MSHKTDDFIDFASNETSSIHHIHHHPLIVGATVAIQEMKICGAPLAIVIAMRQLLMKRNRGIGNFDTTSSSLISPRIINS